MLIARVLAVLLGSMTVAGTLLSAARTVVVPRQEDPLITRYFFRTMKVSFRAIAGRIDSLEARERVLSRLAPVALLLLPFIWAGFLIVGGAFVYWGFGLTPLEDALVFSGGAFTTFGFYAVEDQSLWYLILAIAQGVLGLEVIALLVSFLPSIYAHFTRRETLVTRLESLAGSPSDPVELLVRAHSIGLLSSMGAVWQDWSNWFAGLDESHTTFPFLVFFRSPEPSRSWLTSSACVLDASALKMAVVDDEIDPWARLSLRAGYLALRRVADAFGLDHPADPLPTDPISITRERFDEMVRDLGRAGVPLVSDLDQAWRDYAGWRVNYDAVVVGLAELIFAPPSPSIAS